MSTAATSASFPSVLSSSAHDLCPRPISSSTSIWTKLTERTYSVHSSGVPFPLRQGCGVVGVASVRGKCVSVTK